MSQVDQKSVASAASTASAASAASAVSAASAASAASAELPTGPADSKTAIGSSQAPDLKSIFTNPFMLAMEKCMKIITKIPFDEVADYILLQLQVREKNEAALWAVCTTAASKESLKKFLDAAVSAENAIAGAASFGVAEALFMRTVENCFAWCEQCAKDSGIVVPPPSTPYDRMLADITEQRTAIVGTK